MVSWNELSSSSKSQLVKLMLIIASFLCVILNMYDLHKYGK